MAMANGIFGATFKNVFLDAHDTAFDWDADQIKVALHNDSEVCNFDETATAWSATNEATFSAVYVSGGSNLASPVIRNGAADTGTADYLEFDGTDHSWGTTATISVIHGCILYNDDLVTPVANPKIVAVDFAGAPLDVSNGTFTIQWDTNGIFRIHMI